MFPSFRDQTCIWKVLHNNLQVTRIKIKIPLHFFPWLWQVGSQETPGITGKFGHGVWNEAVQKLIVLPREYTGHSKHPLTTTQEKTLHMDITRWSTPKSDWLYSLLPKMEKLYTVSKNKTRSWLWLRSWTPYCQIQTEIEESGENHLNIWKFTAYILLKPGLRILSITLLACEMSTIVR